MSEKKPTLPPWATKSRLWAGFAVAIIAVYAAAPKIGIELPRPAFAGELRQVEMELAGSLEVLRKDIKRSNAVVLKQLYRLEARSAKQDLNRARNELKRTQRQIEKAAAAGEPTSRLRNDETEQETDLEEARDEFKRAKVKSD